MANPARKIYTEEVSDDELLRMSAANDNLQFERVNGELVTMAPVGSFGGNLESEYIFEVTSWARKNKAESYSSSASFKLANNSVRAPNAAIVLPSNRKRFVNHILT